MPTLPVRPHPQFAVGDDAIEIADENDASLIWNEHRVGLNFSALRDMLRDTASWRREKADEFADDPLDLDIARLMDELADDVSRRIANGEEFAYRAKASHRLILARADTLMTASFNRDFPMADGTLRPLVRDGNFVAFENYVVELRAAIRARAVVEN